MNEQLIRMKQLLDKLLEEKDLSDPEALLLSCEIDQLIIEYYKSHFDECSKTDST